MQIEDNRTASTKPNAKIVQVKCPKCGALSDFAVWPVVSSVHLPEVAESLRKGSLFKYECSGCGYRDIVPYQCLYHDAAHGKVALLQPNASKYAEVEAELMGMVNQGKIGRLVFHPARLAEKARIFEAGLDDCAIELMKCKTKEHLIGDDPLFETMDLYFQEAADDYVVFFGSGFEDGALTILKTMYDQAVIDLMAHPPKEDCFVVDERWAEGYLRDAVLAEAEELRG